MSHAKSQSSGTCDGVGQLLVVGGEVHVVVDDGTNTGTSGNEDLVLQSMSLCLCCFTTHNQHQENATHQRWVLAAIGREVTVLGQVRTPELDA
jgi:hypothetical protein